MIFVANTFLSIDGSNATYENITQAKYVEIHDKLISLEFHIIFYYVMILL